MTITTVNGEKVDDYYDFHERLACVTPDETLMIGTENSSYTLKLTASPDDPSKGFMGIQPVQNERRMKDGYEFLKGPFFWTMGLFKWLFLLNLFIGLANLLPLGIVDGGRMLEIVLKKTVKDQKKAHKIWVFIAVLFLFLLVFSLLVNYLGNPFALLG